MEVYNTGVIATFGWQHIDWPSHDPDLALSDFHIFPILKNVSQKDTCISEEVKTDVKQFFPQGTHYFYS